LVRNLLICIPSAFDLNFLFLFKGKKIKEQVSLPHLYPLPPKGRGRIWKEERVRMEESSLPHLCPRRFLRGGFGEGPVYILPLPKTKEGEGEYQSVTKVVGNYI